LSYFSSGSAGSGFGDGGFGAVDCCPKEMLTAKRAKTKNARFIRDGF
jgi:hypothetical protein